MNFYFKENAKIVSSAENVPKRGRKSKKDEKEQTRKRSKSVGKVNNYIFEYFPYFI